MRALSLLIKLVGVLDSLLAGVGIRGEQLAVAENRGERIVEFVSDARNQLADGGHFFAVQQLFLSPAEIVVGRSRFFVEQSAIDRVRDLAPDGDEQVDVGRRELTRGPSTNRKNA